ncbi:hypothetical protein AK812_SmicGene6199 [Symbiodinium microadriaticum]|uniref:C2H2-type domain-containing protein n=1 Tax=Symbiodinium microadriaticum TaxID=2951 RepID=A0A1Q9ERV9_SYMMI|nr:hypothetical protein AK812_SmicGene6199 [Symbiodinium microadriaticum]
MQEQWNVMSDFVRYVMLVIGWFWFSAEVMDMACADDATGVFHILKALSSPAIFLFILESDRSQLGWQAWRGDAHHMHTAQARCKSFDRATACHAAAMRSLSRSLHTAHQRDEAEYVRLMYQDSRAQGPAAIARKIRSVLRCGRRAAVGVPSHLVVAGTPITEHSAILQAFGEHFASAEQAVPTTLHALQDAPPVVTQSAELDLSGAPALADVCSAFASLKSGKAAGISGIPPEAYSQCAAHAAVAHMPLVMKALGRGQLPTLWTGLKAHPIPKPAKPADRVEGYRSIALAEPAAKAVTKATRGVLVQAFEAVTLPTMGGARPGFPAEIPATAVQAHLAMLRRIHRPGAAIFIDGVAAFYSVNREHLFSGDADALRDYVQSLPLDPEVRLRISNAIAGQGALERAALPPAVVRLLRIAFCNTWFTVDPGSEQIYHTAKGTIPGSPLADLLFQFVAGTSLKCLKEHLDDIGVSAVVSVEGAEVRAAPQSWLDDVALLLTSTDAAHLPHDIAAAMRLIGQYMAILGIEVNFAAGKTETVIGWYGKRSTAARRLNLNQICALTGALTPDEAITIRRFRLLSQLCDKADLYLRQCLVEEQSWLRAVGDDVRAVAKTLQHRVLQEHADVFSPCLAWIAGWPFGRGETSALLKRYRLRCLQSRVDLVPAALAKAEAHDKAQQAGLLFFTLSPGCSPKTLHRCRDCGRSFSGPAQLAVHRSQKHGDRAVASEAWGTSCEVCRRQFWSTARLREHFRFLLPVPRCLMHRSSRRLHRNDSHAALFMRFRHLPKEQTLKAALSDLNVSGTDRYDPMSLELVCHDDEAWVDEESEEAFHFLCDEWEPSLTTYPIVGLTTYRHANTMPKATAQQMEHLRRDVFPTFPGDRLRLWRDEHGGVFDPSEPMPMSYSRLDSWFKQY